MLKCKYSYWSNLRSTFLSDIFTVLHDYLPILNPSTLHIPVMNFPHCKVELVQIVENRSKVRKKRSLCHFLWFLPFRHSCSTIKIDFMCFKGTKMRWFSNRWWNLINFFSLLPKWLPLNRNKTQRCSIYSTLTTSLQFPDSWWQNKVCNRVSQSILLWMDGCQDEYF